LRKKIKLLLLCLGMTLESCLLQALKFLVKKGADLAIRNSSGATALHTAASNGSVECVRELLAEGLSIELVDEDGKTAKDRVKIRLAKPAASRHDTEENDNEAEIKESIRRLEEIAGILEFPIAVKKLKESSEWSVADMRAFLSLANIETSGLVEKSDFEAKCKQYLAGIPEGAIPVKPRQRATNSFAR